MIKLKKVWNKNRDRHITLRFVCLDRVDRVVFSAGAFFSFVALTGGTNAGGGILLPSFPFAFSLPFGGSFSSSDNSIVGFVSIGTISNESFDCK